MTSREKLIELLTGYSIDTKNDVEYVVDHLIENRVIVLPCKVGDTVYSFDKYGKSPIVKGCVDEIFIDFSSSGKWIIVMKDEYKRRMTFFEDDIGNTIFFSEEVIKAKLREFKENDR